jgi:hypothetical protein
MKLNINVLTFLLLLQNSYSGVIQIANTGNHKALDTLITLLTIKHQIPMSLIEILDERQQCQDKQKENFILQLCIKKNNELKLVSWREEAVETLKIFNQ